MAKTIFIGRLIDNRRKELKITKVELARRFGTTKQNLWLILKYQSMQTDTIQKFCDALNYDFFQHFVQKTNEEVKQEMQILLDEKDKQIDALNSQLMEANKTIVEKNFIIGVLKGEIK